MKYIFTIKDGKANLVTQCDEYDQIISQDTFPARIEHPNTHAVLSYNETDGIHWEYVPYTAKELRELAYQTEKNIDWDNVKITVNEAVDLWLKYQAEGDTKKALLLTGLITIAKATIRKLYRDTAE